MTDRVYNYITKRYNKIGGDAYKKWLQLGAYDQSIVSSSQSTLSPTMSTYQSMPSPTYQSIPSPTYQSMPSSVIPIVQPISSPIIPIVQPISSSIVRPDVMGPLSGVPDDVLKLMLITLPYQEILNKCATNKQFARICRDRNFWADKAKQDFDISTQTFHSKQGQPAKVYHSIFVAREITKFLTEVFNYVMYMIGWAGPGNPYTTQYNHFFTDESIKFTNRKLAEVVGLYSSLSSDAKKIIEDFRVYIRSGTEYIQDVHNTNTILDILFTFYQSAYNINNRLKRDLYTAAITAIEGSRLFGKTIDNITSDVIAAIFYPQAPQVHQVGGGIQLPTLGGW